MHVTVLTDLEMPQLNEKYQLELIHVQFFGCPVQSHPQGQRRLAVARITFNQDATRAAGLTRTVTARSRLLISIVLRIQIIFPSFH